MRLALRYLKFSFKNILSFVTQSITATIKPGTGFGKTVKT